MRNTEWLDESEIVTVINRLRMQYSDDPINIISYNSIGYVCGLEAIAGFYDDDILKLAAVICRSVIQGHPLQDGNKRFGMCLATYFLELNNVRVTADDDDYVSVALRIAKSEADLEAVYQWFCDNTEINTPAVRGSDSTDARYFAEKH